MGHATRLAALYAAMWGLGPGAAKPAVIERASAEDLMSLASDTVGCPMQVAAVLVLRAPTAQPDAVRAAIADRIRAVPRLRQRLVGAPPGCGRPVWVDDPGFDVEAHVRFVPCPSPGDEPALLALAADLVTVRLPMHRPLWSATLVGGLLGGDAALVVVFHHVLADGIGGLAVLRRLVDGAPAAPEPSFPVPAPSRSALCRDAQRNRLAAARHMLAGVRRLRAGVAEIGAGSTPRAGRSSLNLPTGRHRALAVARVPLAAVRAAAHAHDATVNDVLLTAVSGALRTLLGERGEAAQTLVLSVPVSGRQRASEAQLGNRVGVMPVAVPTLEDRVARLTAISEATKRRRAGSAPGASAALLAPAFRGLARLGLLRGFVNRQRRVNTFVTNVRGPDERLSFLGAPVTNVIPVGFTTGNVTVAFAGLSYAGDLVVSIVADRQRCPDLALLATALQTELDSLTGRLTGGGQSQPIGSVVPPLT